MLWGLYHGVLLVLSRAHRLLRPAARPSNTWLVAARIGGMFVLTNIGWLLFRETELSAIVRDLTLSPFASSDADRQVGLYLFLLVFVYSLPLWAQSLWVELTRVETSSEPAGNEITVGWPRLILQGTACGLALAAILILRSRTSLDFIYFQF